jgi:hypothetical protein
MSATKILWGQNTIVFAIVLIAVWGATQWTRSLTRPTHKRRRERKCVRDEARLAAE